MNKISKFLLLVILFQAFAVTSFALDAPTSDEVLNCATLQRKAVDHRKWSVALEDITESEDLKADELNHIAKIALNKIYEDISSVQDLVGMTEELTVLKETRKLLRRVKSTSIETEKANALMLEKLVQLDRAMFDTLQEAGQSIHYCFVFKGWSGKAAEKLSETTTKSSDANRSSAVQ